VTNTCLLHCHVDFLIHANLLVFSWESHRGRNCLPPRMVMVFVMVHIFSCVTVENGGQAYKKKTKVDDKFSGFVKPQKVMYRITQGVVVYNFSPWNFSSKKLVACEPLKTFRG